MLTLLINQEESPSVISLKLSKPIVPDTPNQSAAW